MDKENGNTPEPEQEAEKNVLNLYLQELIEKQDNILLKESDLQKLEEKYPLTHHDKEKVEMLAHRHLLRAEQYIKQEKWDTAIVETERALLFTPLDLGLRLDLSELYINRSRQYGYLEKDLHRAEEKIKETLTLKPGYKNALKMQKELQNLNRILKGKDQNKKMIPVILAILFIVGAVSFPRIRQFFFLQNQRDAKQETYSELVNTDWTAKDLSIRTTDSLNERVQLNINKAEIRKKNDGYALSLSGYASTVSGPLEELSLRIHVGDMDSPLIEQELVLLDGQNPVLCAGETLPFQTYINLTDYSSEGDVLSLQLENIKKFSGTADPMEWAENETFWEIPRPDDISLRFTSRQHQYLEGYDRLYLFQDLKMENRSMDGITSLTLKACWLNAQDEEVASREIELVPPGYPPIQAESVQSCRIMLDLPKTAVIPPGHPAIFVQSIQKEKTDETESL